jgi:endonuclease YncB( thermonuclease family)
MPRRELLTNGDDIGVRLSGIDAPEIAGKCAKEKALALVTRDFLRGQLAGASVLLQQVFRDKFFRIEATVIANGVNINQLIMVKKGFAALYTGTGPRHDGCQP